MFQIRIQTLGFGHLGVYSVKSLSLEGWNPIFEILSLAIKHPDLDPDPNA